MSASRFAEQADVMNSRIRRVQDNHIHRILLSDILQREQPVQPGQSAAVAGVNVTRNIRRDPGRDEDSASASCTAMGW